MFTPHAVTVLAQGLLALICAAIGVWAIDPFHVVEGLAFAQDKAAYAVAFYVATGVAAAAFPRLRRNDIALLGLALACLLECGRAIVGGDAAPINLAAAAAGVVAAWAPGAIEQLRRQARLHPYLSFRQINEFQRRQPERADDASWSPVGSQGV